MPLTSSLEGQFHRLAATQSPNHPFTGLFSTADENPRKQPSAVEGQVAKTRIFQAISQFASLVSRCSPSAVKKPHLPLCFKAENMVLSQPLIKPKGY